MATDLDLARVRGRLASLAAPTSDASTRDEPTAAVAAVLREGQLGPEVLFIRRAEFEGDPWSGHMAFPGGRREPHDLDLSGTAVRETQEELGFSLPEHGELIATLDDVPTHTTGLIVRPFVWVVSRDPRLTLNEEVQETIWSPLSPLLGGLQDTTFPLRYRGVSHQFPAYDVDGRVVWGLTYRMLQILFGHLRGE